MDADRLRALVRYNPDTGEFTRLVGTGKGAAAGTVTLGAVDASTGYRRLCVGGRQHYAHRLAWLYMTGHWPAEQIDHINGDRADNRCANLREATNAQNNQRTRARADSGTGVLGVSWHRRAGKYIAQLRHEGVNHYLGLFDSVESAAHARRAAEARFFTHHRSAA